MEFVQRVAGQVRRLQAAGVPSRHIGVVGASKGGQLALMVAAELRDPDVSYVVLAGCGASTVALGPRLRGRVLSIHDEPDRFTPSCRETFAAAPGLSASREIVLRLGLDHGLVYRPRPEWLVPAVEWLTAADPPTSARPPT
jgi:dienelactone hydrolase